MNWLDVTIIAIAALSILIGVKRGLLREAFPLLSTILGFVLALYFVDSAAAITESLISNEILAYIIGFIGVFAAVKILFFLLRKITSKTLETVRLDKIADKWIGGSIFGLVRAVIIIYILIFALNLFGKKEPLNNSKLSPYVLTNINALTNIMGPKIKSIFNEKYRELRESANKTTDERQIKESTDKEKD